MMNQPINRRAFFNSLTGAVTLAGVGVHCSTVQAGIAGDRYQEATRQIPIAGRFDVVVCGGGPAGVSAAISAARSGASVKLIELHGCLGGVWTSGMLSYVIDAEKPGFNTELVSKLEALGGTIYDKRKPKGSKKNYVYDVETMKYLLEDLCQKEKIQIQLHTRVVDAYKNDAGRLETIVTESKSGREAWQADVFIDATGDGDLGSLAGCEWEFGQKKDCPCQPMSLMGVITAAPDVLADFANTASTKNKDRLFKEMAKAGYEPTYAKPTLWHMGGATAAVMFNHEYSVKPYDAVAVTEATIRARRELFLMCKSLRSLEGGWSGTRLITTAEQIGIRDGRRIKGRYFVTVDDLIKGARHEDAICRSTFAVDVHAATRDSNRKAAYSGHGYKAVPYDIPLRALIANDVDGLLMAGRCISGDFFAHASYRVTGNAVAMGEAAGVTATISAKKKQLPQQLEFAMISKELNRIRKNASVSTNHS